MSELQASHVSVSELREALQRSETTSSLHTLEREQRLAVLEHELQMEFVAAHMQTQEFHQRASDFETEACRVVMNEVRSARVSFENAEVGRFGELAQKSHVLETELVMANNHVHSLNGRESGTVGCGHGGS